jgi:hypothetical protein
MMRRPKVVNKRLIITNDPYVVEMPGVPRPIRDFNWVAFWGKITIPKYHGTGRTKEDAINDLLIRDQRKWEAEHPADEVEENSAERSG